MSILSKFTDWLTGQSRRARRKGQSLLDGLIGRGVPKAEAAHRVKLEVEGSASNYRRIPPGRLEAVGFSRNSKRYAPVGKSGRLLVKRSISKKSGAIVARSKLPARHCAAVVRVRRGLPLANARINRRRLKRRLKSDKRGESGFRVAAILKK